MNGVFGCFYIFFIFLLIFTIQFCWKYQFVIRSNFFYTIVFFFQIGCLYSPQWCFTWMTIIDFNCKSNIYVFLIATSSMVKIFNFNKWTNNEFFIISRACNNILVQLKDCICYFYIFKSKLFKITTSATRFYFN